jgi:hypothetical protein
MEAVNRTDTAENGALRKRTLQGIYLSRLFYGLLRNPRLG